MIYVTLPNPHGDHFIKPEELCLSVCAWCAHFVRDVYSLPSMLKEIKWEKHGKISPLE